MVELRCFKGAKHKFEIDYEYQVHFKSFAILAFYTISQNPCQEIDKEDVNTDPNQGAKDPGDGANHDVPDRDSNEPPEEGESSKPPEEGESNKPPEEGESNKPSGDVPFKGDHPPRPHQNDPSDKSGRSSPKRKKFRCE